MKKFVVIVLCLGLIGLVGCRKKQPSLEEMQEPMSMEALSQVPAGQESVEPKAPVAQTPVPQPVAAPVTTKPTNQEIQIALKNAGFYTGEIDGKIGPMTKKAIEEFQKANNLKVDGKVGPQTWATLSPYLNPPAETKAGR